MEFKKQFSLSTLPTEGSPYALCFTPEGRWLVGGSARGAVWMMETQPEASPILLGRHLGPVWSLQAIDDSLVASVSEDGAGRLWHIELGRGLHVFHAPFPLRTMVCYNTLFIMGGKGKSLLCQDAYLWQAEPELGPLAGEVTSLALAPKRQLLFAGLGTLQGEIYLWDVAKGEAMALLEGDGAPVTALACTPDGNRLVAAYANGAVILWDVAARQHIKRRHHKAILYRLVYLHPHTLLAQTSQGELVVIAEETLLPVTSLPKEAPPEETRGHSVQAFAIDPQQNRVAVACSSGRIDIYTYTHGMRFSSNPSSARQPRRNESSSNESHSCSKQLSGGIKMATSPDMRMVYGRNCMLLALYREALAAFEQVVKEKPDLTEAHFQSGMAHLQLGEFAQAKEAFQTVIEQLPTHAPAHNNLGTLLLQAKEFDEAVYHFQQALRARPYYPLAHVNLGLAYWYSNHRDEAEKALLQALNEMPCLPIARYHMALLCLEKGAEEEAQSHYLFLTQLDRKLASKLRTRLISFKEEALSEEEWKARRRLGERLISAAANGATSAVRRLLAQGAPWYEMDPETGRTPLLIAAANGHYRVVKALLSARAEPNEPDSLGKTALYLAVEGGFTSCVSLLLRFGANPHFADYKGQTPLHIAAIMGDRKCLSLLLAAEAHPNLPDREGNTPCDLAKTYGHEACVHLLQKKRRKSPCS